MVLPYKIYYKESFGGLKVLKCISPFNPFYTRMNMYDALEMLYLSYCSR